MSCSKRVGTAIPIGIRFLTILSRLQEASDPEKNGITILKDRFNRREDCMGAWRARRQLICDRVARMFARVEHERSLAGGGVFGIVHGELNER